MNDLYHFDISMHIHKYPVYKRLLINNIKENKLE